MGSELSWTYVGFTSVQFAHLAFPISLVKKRKHHISFVLKICFFCQEWFRLRGMWAKTCVDGFECIMFAHLLVKVKVKICESESKNMWKWKHVLMAVALSASCLPTCYLSNYQTCTMRKSQRQVHRGNGAHLHISCLLTLLLQTVLQTFTRMRTSQKRF